MESKVSFKFDSERARMLQLFLSNKVIERDCFNYPPRIICGVDASYKGNLAVGAAVTLTFPSMNVIEEAVVTCNVSFPYIAGFFAFRELQPILKAIRSLSSTPDVILVDGHGRAHPRKFGLACHLGLVLNVPSIGVAKRKLCGDVILDKPLRDNVFPVILNGELVGAMIKSHGKQLFVSVGHKISLETAIDIVLHCIKSHYIPMPIMMAHEACRRRLTSISI
ncbi:MAG: endonuclease V [archaeon GB-1867-035]|nr:endonuclease V [Candidatus Culexmicrobium profundum]